MDASVNPAMGAGLRGMGERSDPLGRRSRLANALDNDSRRAIDRWAALEHTARPTGRRQLGSADTLRPLQVAAGLENPEDGPERRSSHASSTRLMGPRPGPSTL